MNSLCYNADTFSPRIKEGKIVIDVLNMSDEEIKAIKKIMIVACGSAYHTGVTSKYILEGLARIPVEVDLASEFRYHDPLLEEGTLVIDTSQSRNESDFGQLYGGKSEGAKVLGIVNVVGSSIAREADGRYTHGWGPRLLLMANKSIYRAVDSRIFNATEIYYVRKMEN